MIKIEKMADIRILTQKSNIHPLIAKYLSNYLCSLLHEYDCENLSAFGSIYLLENSYDSLNHKKIGLSLPLAESFPEFTEFTMIRSSIEKITLLHSCFVLTNDCAISVFAEKGVLDYATEKHLLQNSLEVEVQIDDNGKIKYSL